MPVDHALFPDFLPLTTTTTGTGDQMRSPVVGVVNGRKSGNNASTGDQMQTPAVRTNHYKPISECSSRHLRRKTAEIRKNLGLSSGATGTGVYLALVKQRTSPDSSLSSPGSGGLVVDFTPIVSRRTVIRTAEKAAVLTALKSCTTMKAINSGIRQLQTTILLIDVVTIDAVRCTLYCCVFFT
jgi:hypothetical protein